MLRRRWARLPEQQTFGGFVDSEVMARQVMNAALAMKMARDSEMQWLVHVDADELFYAPRQSVAEHFEWAQAQMSNAIKYWNYEAVPERDDIADPFRDVTLFKIPPALQRGDGAKDLPPAARFHFYSNGKAAVRLDASGMRPRSVHDFDNPASPAPPLAAPGAFILHYARCGFENFWHKYRTLGAFGDKWFGKTDIRAAVGSSLHLEARDVVAAGDRGKALEFYLGRIAMEDSAMAEALMRAGALTRFSGPRSFLTVK